MRKNKNQGNTYSMIGVDFGSQSIKAVALVNGSRTSNFQIESCCEVVTPKGAIMDYQIQNTEQVSKSVAQLLRTLGVKTRYVATSVSGSNVISKVVPVDNTITTDEALQEYINRESDQLIPFASEDVSLDFEIIGPNLEDPSKSDVLVSATRSSNVSDRLEVFGPNNYETKVIDVSIHAIARAVKAIYPNLAVADSKTCAIVDIGAVTMTFGVMVNGEIVYTRLQSFGGDNFTQSIAHFYNVPYDEAEKMKVQERLPADALSDVIPQHFSMLTSQIKRNLQLYASTSSNNKVSMIILTGGGSLVPGLAEHLSNQLKIEVKHPDPLDSSPNQRSDSLKHGAKYMTALGLALRSFEPCQI
jgi:type IV pilus assembly protein PilM